MKRAFLILLPLALILGSVARPAHSQFLQRLKDKAKEVAKEEALGQADQLIGDVAANNVGDGRFYAVLTPWAAASRVRS